jgi:cupin 2 domain-containing protein
MNLTEMKTKNIFNNIPSEISQEIFENLLENKNIRIERIISKGQYSAPGFWYDQYENEWVILLKGKAKLLFKNESKEIYLSPGDFINIPSHIKHRVDWTDPNEKTIWLAIFY